MNIFKILLLSFSLKNINSEKTVENPIIKKEKKNKNNLSKKIKQILNHIKREQKFFYKVQHGHKLENFNKVKIGMSKKEVIDILGQPAELKCIKNSFYYISQTNLIICTFNFLLKGKIVKITFKNGKVENIREIKMKKPRKNHYLYVQLKYNNKEKLKKM